MDDLLSVTHSSVSSYSPSELEAHFKHTVSEADLNVQGQLFGGQLLYWMDGDVGKSMRAAVSGAAATGHISDVHFLAPAHLGDKLTLTCTPIFSGTTSIVWQVSVFNQNTQTLMVKAYFTMVYLGKTMPKVNKAQILPIKIVPKTEDEMAAYNYIARLRKHLLHKTNTV